MKMYRITTAIVIIAFVSLVTFVSCNKEQTTTATIQSEATLDCIMDFKHQLEAVEADSNERTVTYMSIADAVWNVEALFNITYAYPDEDYSQVVGCDTSLFLPVCANDSVSIHDLSVFYGNMFSAVQALYQATNLNDKQFLILDVEAGERVCELQVIKLYSIQGSLKGEPQNPYPWQLEDYFEVGSPWYYGEDHGRLDGNFYGEMDAADTLSNMLNDNLVQKAPNGLSYIYTNIIMKELDENDHVEFSYHPYNGCGQFCEFYVSNPSGGDYWLDADDMNFFYYGERHLVKNVLRTYGNVSVPSTHNLINVIINDHHNTSAIWHHTQATYGLVSGIGKNEIVKGNL